MYLFSDYLKDVLVEKAVPDSEINYEFNRNGLMIAVFKVGDVHIKVRIIINDREHEDMSYGIMGITFSFYDPETGEEGYEKLDIGYRHGRTVIDTIAKLVREFMQEYGDIVSIVNYSASGKSRISLYNWLTKEFIRNGFVDFSETMGDEYKKFILVRSDYVDAYEKYKDEI